MAWYTPLIDSFKEIPDDVRNTLTGFLYGLLGFISSMAVEWYKKRKSPKELTAEIDSKIVSSAKENVEIAQNVIDLLEERLKGERQYYDSKIEQSKLDCEEKILKLKENYDKALLRVQEKNDKEKESFQKKIHQLEIDKEYLQKQVSELKEILKSNGINYIEPHEK